MRYFYKNTVEKYNEYLDRGLYVLHRIGQDMDYWVLHKYRIPVYRQPILSLTNTEEVSYAHKFEED